MAYVIVSAGHPTDLRLRTLRARPVLAATAGVILALMAACLALGFQLARQVTPAGPLPTARLDSPELRSLVNRVGQLAGQLSQLERQAATLAQRLGPVPNVAILTPAAGSRPTSNPWRFRIACRWPEAGRRSVRRAGTATILANGGGRVQGDVEVENFIELQPGAPVVGDIRYRHLRMECGATVDGRLERLPEPGSAMAAAAATDNVVALPRAQGGDT